MFTRRCTCRRLRVLLLVLGSVVVASAALAQESLLWGDLEAGPHAVGFMTTEEYDYSRTFQPKRDYFGEIVPGEMARPIQVCIWYPAVEVADASPVVFSEYAFAPPEDRRFYGFLSQIQNREIGFLHRILSNDQTAVLEVLGSDMKAVQNAEPAEGAFPLLIYHTGFNNGIAENAVMCEYLASQGFVVATTHAFGPATYRMGEDPAALETIVGDMEFVLASTRDLDFVDHDKVGALGYRAGGLAALLLQMRNFSVDAVVGIEPSFLVSDRMELATGNPYFDASRMTVPLMQVYTAATEGQDMSLFESFDYAGRYSLGFGGESPALSTYRLIMSVFGGPQAAPLEEAEQAHAAACRYVMSFFDGHLNGSEEGLAFLEYSPDELGLDPELLTVSRTVAQDRPPNQDEFMAMLAEGAVEQAIELYDRFIAEDPDLVLFQEAQMNMAGYRLLQQGRTQEAVPLFRMNAETYPQSANCWDSLTEAYMAIGDNVHALECVHKVLETLPDDTNISDDLRQALETNAERYMEMLTAEETEEETTEEEE